MRWTTGGTQSNLMSFHIVYWPGKIAMVSWLLSSLICGHTMYQPCIILFQVLAGTWNNFSYSYYQLGCEIITIVCCRNSHWLASNWDVSIAYIPTKANHDCELLWSVTLVGYKLLLINELYCVNYCGVTNTHELLIVDELLVGYKPIATVGNSYCINYCC